MLRSWRVLIVGVALLGGCASQGRPPATYKSSSGPDFASDRASCLQEAAFTAPGGGKITFGGGYGGNPFVSSGPYLDCMVGRGYKADDIGDVLGTPSTKTQMGN